MLKVSLDSCLVVLEFQVDGKRYVKKPSISRPGGHVLVLLWNPDCGSVPDNWDDRVVIHQGWEAITKNLFAVALATCSALGVEADKLILEGNTVRFDFRDRSLGAPVIDVSHDDASGVVEFIQKTLFPTTHSAATSELVRNILEGHPNYMLGVLRSHFELVPQEVDSVGNCFCHLVLKRKDREELFSIAFERVLSNVGITSTVEFFVAYFGLSVITEILSKEQHRTLEIGANSSTPSHDDALALTRLFHVTATHSASPTNPSTVVVCEARDAKVFDTSGDLKTAFWQYLEFRFGEEGLKDLLATLVLMADRHLVKAHFTRALATVFEESGSTGRLLYFPEGGKDGAGSSVAFAFKSDVQKISLSDLRLTGGSLSGNWLLDDKEMYIESFSCVGGARAICTANAIYYVGGRCGYVDMVIKNYQDALAVYRVDLSTRQTVAEGHHRVRYFSGPSGNVFFEQGSWSESQQATEDDGSTGIPLSDRPIT